jgi:hypothetical protein
MHFILPFSDYAFISWLATLNHGDLSDTSHHRDSDLLFRFQAFTDKATTLHIRILYNCLEHGNQDSWVSIPTRLWAGWQRTQRVEFRAEVRDFSLLLTVQTSSRAHPVYEADHSLHYNAKIKNDGFLPPFPHTFSWHDAQLIKHRCNFTFILQTGKWTHK